VDGPPAEAAEEKSTTPPKARVLRHAKTTSFAVAAASAVNEAAQQQGSSSFCDGSSSLYSSEMSKLDEEYRELMKRKSESSQSRAPVPKMATDELDQLEALFREVDKNGDGVVDFNEFKVVMGVLGQQTGKTYNFLQLKGLFRLADLDGSGSIDFNEFLHAQRRVTKNYGTATSAALMAAAISSTRGAEGGRQEGS